MLYFRNQHPSSHMVSYFGLLFTLVAFLLTLSNYLLFPILILGVVLLNLKSHFFIDPINKKCWSGIKLWGLNLKGKSEDISGYDKITFSIANFQQTNNSVRGGATITSSTSKYQVNLRKGKINKRLLIGMAKSKEPLLSNAYKLSEQTGWPLKDFTDDLTNELAT
jgi:hypothetical protein